MSWRSAGCWIWQWGGRGLSCSVSRTTTRRFTIIRIQRQSTIPWCDDGRFTDSSCEVSRIHSSNVSIVPIPTLNAPTRNTTITALQSLALLNDLFMIRQSQYFARRLENLSTDPRRRIEAAVLLALGRHPVPEEADALENICVQAWPGQRLPVSAQYQRVCVYRLTKEPR